ncbi:cytochrome P450 [Cunninghamella echinulata]|nr:cytochrome P450 [Cunninghamella echinulata]
MDTVNNIIIKIKEEWFKKKADKNTTVTIGAAVALVVLYSIYDKVAKPPRKLRHLPYINFFSYYKLLMRGEPYSTISKQLTIPLLNSKQPEVYVQKDLLGWTVKVASPSIAKQVFLKSGTLKQKHVGSNNIVMTHDPSTWKRHRMLVNPAFHRSMPIKLFSDLTNRLFKVIDGANEDELDILSYMDRVTLDAIGKAGFGFDFNASSDPHSEWVETYNIIKDANQSPLFFMFPFLETKFLWLFPKRRREHALSVKFHKMLDEIIEHKRKTLKDHANTEDAEKDLLTLMLESELNGEGSLTNEELNSDLNVFFTGNHDTTSSTMSSIFYYLAKHPDVQQRAREEAIKIFGDEPADISPTADQLKELVYINQVIKETLRMNGPALQITPRCTTKDTEIEGVFLPKGTKVTVAIYDLHHSPYNWKNPEEFNPDRFADGGEAEQKERGGLSWAPFARMCIGMNFSLAEQRIILSSFLRKYEWSLPEDSIHKDGLITNNLFIISPKDLKLKFKRRY